MPEGEKDDGAVSVFVSHASEDQERFVLDFAKDLRSRGVDAWVSEWEILPGDSLVDKIFEEGLKEADAVIVVVSSNSVESRWVREELNAAMVKRIERKAKVIPVVIDDCRIPEALRATVWEPVEDTGCYGDALDRVIRAIYDEREKPPVGSPPDFASGGSLRPVRDLTKSENVIFRIVAEASVENYPHPASDEELEAKASKHDIEAPAVREALTILKNRRLVTGFASRAGLRDPKLTKTGWGKYVERAVSNLDEVERAVALHVANRESDGSKAIAGALDVPHWLAAYCLRELETRGFVELFNAGDGSSRIQRVSVELKRALRLGSCL